MNKLSKAMKGNTNAAKNHVKKFYKSNENTIKETAKGTAIGALAFGLPMGLGVLIPNPRTKNPNPQPAVGDMVIRKFITDRIHAGIAKKGLKEIVKTTSLIPITTQAVKTIGGNASKAQLTKVAVNTSKIMGKNTLIGIGIGAGIGAVVGGVEGYRSGKEKDLRNQGIIPTLKPTDYKFDYQYEGPKTINNSLTANSLVSRAIEKTSDIAYKYTERGANKLSSLKRKYK